LGDLGRRLRVLVRDLLGLGDLRTGGSAIGATGLGLAARSATGGDDNAGRHEHPGQQASPDWTWPHISERSRAKRHLRLPFSAR
jgi:hypothetical protein